MIILIKGNVKYPITLDPTVWIFDDRKIALEQFLSGDNSAADNEYAYASYEHKIKPPVQASLEKFKQAGPGSGSYVMPLNPFIERAEPSADSTKVQLFSEDHTLIAELTMNEMIDSVLLFAIEGKRITENGPAHLYLNNQANTAPIKGFTTILIA